MKLARRSFLASLLAGCADAELPPAIEIAPGLGLRLPPPAALGVTLEAAQSISATVPDAAPIAFTNQIAVSPGRLLLVMLDALGRRGMTLRWSGTTLAVERADWLPPVVRPGNIVADVMLLYAPAAAIRAGLPDAVTLGDDTLSRQLERGGERVLEIAYATPAARRWQGRARVRNLAYGYALDIQSTVLA